MIAQLGTLLLARITISDHHHAGRNVDCSPAGDTLRPTASGLGDVVLPQQERVNRAGIEWLSAATDDPRTTRYNWTEVPYELQLVRPGRIFDAVITRDDTGGDVLERMAARRQPVGAVVGDSRARHWAWLVGPGSEGAWRLTVGPPADTHARGWYRYINSHGALLIPGPVPEPGGWLRWIVPPGLGENLTPLTALAVAFMEAARER